MSLWKTAMAGAVLTMAACQPVGMPLGEKRYAEKIAEVVFTTEDVNGFAMQQVQGLMYQGSVTPEQASQVGLAVGREMEAALPEIKKTLVDGLTREFNVKELEFLYTQMTSDIARNVAEKQEAAMSDAIQHLQRLAQEATTRAVERVNAAWPTGAQTPPAAPTGPELPPGVVLPN